MVFKTAVVDLHLCRSQHCSRLAQLAVLDSHLRLDSSQCTTHNSTTKLDNPPSQSSLNQRYIPACCCSNPAPGTAHAMLHMHEPQFLLPTQLHQKMASLHHQQHKLCTGCLSKAVKQHALLTAGSAHINTALHGRCHCSGSSCRNLPDALLSDRLLARLTVCNCLVCLHQTRLSPWSESLSVVRSLGPWVAAGFRGSACLHGTTLSR